MKKAICDFCKNESVKAFDEIEKLNYIEKNGETLRIEIKGESLTISKFHMSRDGNPDTCKYEPCDFCASCIVKLLGEMIDSIECGAA